MLIPITSKGAILYPNSPSTFYGEVFSNYFELNREFNLFFVIINLNYKNLLVIQLLLILYLDISLEF